MGYFHPISVICGFQYVELIVHHALSCLIAIGVIGLKSPHFICRSGALKYFPF